MEGIAVARIAQGYLNWNVTRAGAADNGEVRGLVEQLKQKHPAMRVETIRAEGAKTAVQRTHGV